MRYFSAIAIVVVALLVSQGQSQQKAGQTGPFTVSGNNVVSTFCSLQSQGISCSTTDGYFGVLGVSASFGGGAEDPNNNAVLFADGTNAVNVLVGPSLFQTVGFNGSAATGPMNLPVNATDLPSALNLLNAIAAGLEANGLAVGPDGKIQRMRSKTTKKVKSK